jgi:hypothetical protein
MGTAARVLTKEAAWQVPDDAHRGEHDTSTSDCLDRLNEFRQRLLDPLYLRLQGFCSAISKQDVVALRALDAVGPLLCHVGRLLKATLEQLCSFGSLWQQPQHLVVAKKQCVKKQTCGRGEGRRASWGGR